MSFLFFCYKLFICKLLWLEKRGLVFLLSITCNYVVYVQKCFPFLIALGIGFVISSPEPSCSQG